MNQTELKIPVKTKVTKEFWVDACNVILNAKMDDKKTLEALMDYANNFSIATESDLLNGLINKTKTR